jgi:hypothetical protein
MNGGGQSRPRSTKFRESVLAGVADRLMIGLAARVPARAARESVTSAPSDAGGNSRTALTRRALVTLRGHAGRHGLLALPLEEWRLDAVGARVIVTLPH